MDVVAGGSWCLPNRRKENFVSMTSNFVQTLVISLPLILNLQKLPLTCPLGYSTRHNPADENATGRLVDFLVAGRAASLLHRRVPCSTQRITNTYARRDSAFSRSTSCLRFARSIDS